MDYKKNASEILELLGGPDNIISVSHCLTRLRLNIDDLSKIDEAKLQDHELVKGTFNANGQYQVIIGPKTVDLVYDELRPLVGEDKAVSKEEGKNIAAQRMSWFSKLIKTLSAIFVPLLPAIVLAGLTLGINNLLTGVPFGFLGGKTFVAAFPGAADFINMLVVIGNGALTFLPVLVAWSATKQFGGNPVLGLALGFMLIHPDLLNGWAYGGYLAEGKEIPYWNIFGFHIEKVGYQGLVLPSLVASWVLVWFEKKFEKIVPGNLQLLLVPVFTVFLTGILTFVFIGPLTRWLGTMMAQGIIFLFDTVPFIAGPLYGALFAPLVITGMHHTLIGVNLELVNASGGTFLWTIEALSNMSQASACIGIFLLSKKAKLRELSSASAISAYFGITEPAMFGVTLKYKWAFLCAMISSAIAGLYVTMTGVRAVSIGVGGLPAILNIIPDNNGFLNYFIAMLIVIILPIVLVLVVGKTKQEELNN